MTSGVVGASADEPAISGVSVSEPRPASNRANHSHLLRDRRIKQAPSGYVVKYQNSGLSWYSVRLYVAMPRAVRAGAPDPALPRDSGLR